MTEQRWEYVTRIRRVRNGDRWPMNGPRVLITGDWGDNQKIVAIEQWHGSWESEIVVSWIERIPVDDTPPAPLELSDYEQLREELQA